MNKPIDCKDGVLVVNDKPKPLHLVCNPPGLFLRIWHGVTEGSIWTCNVCKKQYVFAYHECTGTCNLEPGYYWKLKE